jgi:hypothetical protein
MKTYNDGLQRAVDYLLATAADYEQMRDQCYGQVKTCGRYLSARELNAAQNFEEKAKLLRGQAGHLLNLMERR